MKKFLCVLLSLVLLLTALPLTAFAEETADDRSDIDCWRNKGTDQAQCVQLFVMRKFVPFGGWRSWLEIAVLTKDGIYFYSSEHLGTGFFQKPSIQQIAENDPNLRQVYPVIEDYLLNRYAMTFYKEELEGQPEQQMVLGTLQDLFDEWIEDVVYDTLNEVCFSSMGVTFSFDEVIGALYAESMDLQGVLGEIDPNGEIASKFFKWLMRIFTVLFAIEKHRPSGETIANIPLGQVNVDALEARSEAVAVALHESVGPLIMQHGQFLPMGESS